MQTKFKRHQPVRILVAPLGSDVEPYAGPPAKIKAGMKGKINIILPNGQYHVAITNDKGEIIAYIALDEDQIEAI